MDQPGEFRSRKNGRRSGGFRRVLWATAFENAAGVQHIESQFRKLLNGFPSEKLLMDGEFGHFVAFKPEDFAIGGSGGLQPLGQLFDADGWFFEFVFCSEDLSHGDADIESRELRPAMSGELEGASELGPAALCTGRAFAELNFHEELRGFGGSGNEIEFEKSGAGGGRVFGHQDSFIGSGKSLREEGAEDIFPGDELGVVFLSEWVARTGIGPAGALGAAEGAVSRVILMNQFHLNGPLGRSWPVAC